MTVVNRAFMKPSYLTLGAAVLIFVSRVESSALPDEATFFGMCDASAAAAIDAGHFVVADDEDNVLRVFSREGGKALAEYDLSEFLGNSGKKKAKEADLEGGAQIGTRTYWITSHGRNSKGKETPERQRLFATDVKFENGTFVVSHSGKPYNQLLDDLLSEPKLASYGLKAAAELAPKSPGAGIFADRDKPRIEPFEAFPP